MQKLIVLPLLANRRCRPMPRICFRFIAKHQQLRPYPGNQLLHITIRKIRPPNRIREQSITRKHNIILLTNYETSWYAGNHKAYGMVHRQNAIGPIRKMVVHSGHAGPIAIGVQPEFLEWLVDPVKNGGGAVIDFGCYGANLMTWLMKGEKPVSVSAVLQTNRPDLYEVDDEATIILQYPQAQGIIQASWCWPYNRKDMELYGDSGFIEVEAHNLLNVRLGDSKKEEVVSLGKVPNPWGVAFIRLAKIIANKEELPPFDLSSLENNMIVMEILDAAIRSANEGRHVEIAPGG